MDEKRSITLLDAMESYLAEQSTRVLPRQSENTRRHAERFIEAMGTDRDLKKSGRLIVDVLATRLQKYVDSMKGQKPNTVRHRLKSANGILNWCVRRGFLAVNPLKFIKLPSIKKTEPVIYSHMEYLRIIEAAKGTHLHWLVICAYRTGLSMVDICNLKWSSVDLKDLIIITNRQKLARRGGGRVFIPILPGSDLHQCLLLLKEAPSEDAWPGPGYVHHGLALTYQTNSHTLVQQYTTFMKKLGIPKTFKSLRNTFLSALANSGVQTTIACKISGHSNPAEFAAYVKPDPTAMRAVMTAATDFMEEVKENEIKTK